MIESGALTSDARPGAIFIFCQTVWADDMKDPPKRGMDPSL
jgi:hypothetical protein